MARSPQFTPTAPSRDDMERTLRHLEAAHALTLRLGAQLDLASLTAALASALADEFDGLHAAVLVADEESGLLKCEAVSPPDDGGQLRASLTIPYLSDDCAPTLAAWLRAEGVWLSEADLERSSFRSAAEHIAVPCLSLPFSGAGHLHGVALIWRPGGVLDEPTQQHFQALAPSAAIALHNARQHSQTVAELAAKMHELHILRRIDRELMDTMELEPVFDLTLDWGLRFTKAQAASLALYDQDTDQLYGYFDYGYEIPPEQINLLRGSYGGGIAIRVARSGRPEIIPDVTLDNDYVPIANHTRSMLAMPVMRNDRVVAVMSIESRRLNGFTDDHIEFVEKLVSRAGVAIDNARLYTETKREREKLSRILSAIADVVIVVGGSDDKLALVNQSAVAALRLAPDRNYVGQRFAETFGEQMDFQRIFQRAKANGGGIEELRLADGRTFYVNISLQSMIGWIIVMHDITPLKLTDQLKTELVQTVSHDLKQPLGVMNGYIELIELQNKLDASADTYVMMIKRSINAMRQLIDDLLDLAKIESGVKLDLTPTELGLVIAESVDAVRLMADSKGTTIVNEIGLELPPVPGDSHRLTQIFSNLIGNAIKYSPRQSKVHIWAEVSDSILRVAVQDNGIGIAPEDQARIFDRFYRVRRPETKDIEGTGLGLAIVKRLVEAHGGQIRLESRLGEGTTFYVSLPLA